MKKGIIAIALLVSGVLLITPIANAISQNNKQENVAPVKVEQATNTAKTEVVKNNEEKTTQKQEAKKPAKVETVAVKTKKPAKVKVETKKEEAKKVETKKEETTKPANNTVVKDDKDKEEVKTGMTKSQAEAVLNKYLKEVEKVDFTYTYQGNENTFKAMNKKGIRGYVFLPNIETDLAYLVDKDSGSIYFFHPSGYFELLQ
ncbi:hypothetical protein TPDSL_12960 [Terrisporobacter petrolearius]|uniref:Uncharacterized protein n=1 Tax=Terrisporobacter hibernicus TaxID=2813371 RepID=A0AAX2ZGJ1_9FIRM|nr:hypothetical protein [Terrisporobacter hibernicus]UEL48444.1 hypothetical protein JW646_03045 [Terrisporobacter hibernicus]SFJ34811.1 hypothetical protein SAMN02910355_2354 [Terrisporobacter glycolicus]